MTAMLRFLAVSLLLFMAHPATAQNRHALVIGIDSYTQVAALQKARNDAIAIARTLELAGFLTDLVLDADQLEMATSLARLANRIVPGDEVVFFFAGHGVEIDGRNYLLPADVPMALPGQEIVLLSRAMEVSTVIDTLRMQGARISLLILDACRDNPFPQHGTRSLGGQRGLARVAAPEGTFVMFSAGDGQAALDRLWDGDPDPNSVFTRILLPRLAQPGLPIHQLAREVRTEVRQLARTVDHEQFPAVYDQFDGEFALVPDGSPPLARPAAQPDAPMLTAPDPCTRAREDWALISDITDRAVIETFLAEYAQCALMAALARARLAEIAPAPPDAPAPASRLIPPTDCALQIAVFDRPDDLLNYLAIIPDDVRDNMQVFSMSQRRWAVTLGVISRSEQAWALEWIRTHPLLPSDAQCTAGEGYLETLYEGDMQPTREILRINDPNDGWLNFRTGPGTSHSIIRQLDNGTRVQVIGRSGNWAEVMTSAFERGWVFGRYTETIHY
ncbi:MAG: caspase family protein [Cyclobacteriaceae bacterium]|nr:caspase family protein [Cyclobacteriaceae bacterium]